MKTGKSNKELLLKIKEGDQVAYYHLYERYCKRLFGFVLRYLKVEVEAEGVVQDVFIKIWENRDKIDVFFSFESYLFTIAYNETISCLRKKVNEKKYIDHLKIFSQLQSAPDVLKEIHYKELNEKVEGLLNQLTPRQKEIYQLCREEGLSHAEIAKKLDISVNTVKKHMTNTLAFLKSHIDNGLIVSVLYICLFL